MPSRREKIFISYAHADAEVSEEDGVNLVKEFRKQLKASELDEKSLSIWDDQQIKAGDEWFKAIKDAIDESCLAVLLVSADFLVSDFIRKHELPWLREATNSGLKITWIALKPVNIPEEISRYQALNENPKHAVSTLKESAQALEFRDICKKIQNLRLAQVKVEDGGRPADKGLTCVRQFHVRPSDLGACVIDDKGQLWVADDRQIRLMHVGQDGFVGREDLPRSQWKAYADSIWREQLVLSNWNGDVCRFDGQRATIDKPLYEAQPDDLPVHRLAVSQEGRLFAASWNGVIRRWDVNGDPCTDGWPIVVPALPLHLAPLADGGLAVADQNRKLHLYTSAGKLRRSWSAEQPIHRLWTYDARSDAVAVQVGPQRLLNLVNGRTEESLDFAAPIHTLAQGKPGAGGQWVVVATADGRVEWLSMSSFDKVDGADVGTVVRQLHVLPDMTNAGRPLAVGLTETGRLFTLDESVPTHYPAPVDIRRFFVDPLGRFLFLFFERDVEVYLNPAAPKMPCRVDLVGQVTGQLRLNRYGKLHFTLKNSGGISIGRIDAELISMNVEPSHSAVPDLPAPLLRPGEELPLEFSLLAKVGGDLPLKLVGTLYDEAGVPTPFEKTILVQSEG